MSHIICKNVSLQKRNKLKFELTPRQQNQVECQEQLHRCVGCLSSGTSLADPSWRGPSCASSWCRCKWCRRDQTVFRSGALLLFICGCMH